MKNIMMLINSFNLGGAEKLVYDLSPLIDSDKDFQVCICAMKAVETDLEKDIVIKLEQQGIKCFSINKGFQTDRLKCIFKIRKLLKQQNIDILHTHGQSPDLYGRLAASFSKIETIVTIHSTTGYSAKIEYFMNRLTAAYTVVSPDTLQYANKELVLKKRPILIENGIQLNKYIKMKHELNRNFSILSVGRINELKGYEDAVDILAPFLKAHPDAEWKIVGDYKEHNELFKKLKNKISQYGLQKNIIFIGTTLAPMEYYCSADCFFLNSKYEGFGIAYIEAMAAELPVLGNKVGVIYDILSMGGCVHLIQEENVTEYLEKLYQGQEPQIEELKTNRRIVQENYSIESSVSKYIKIYKSLLEI